MNVSRVSRRLLLGSPGRVTLGDSWNIIHGDPSGTSPGSASLPSSAPPGCDTDFTLRRTNFQVEKSDFFPAVLLLLQTPGSEACSLSPWFVGPECAHGGRSQVCTLFPVSHYPLLSVAPAVWSGDASRCAPPARCWRPGGSGAE